MTSTIQSNLIGVAADSSTPLDNGLDGINLQRASINNVISLNTIANNGAHGIRVQTVSSTPPVGNLIRFNSIHSNGDLGIDLVADDEFGDQVTDNDIGDVDTGPNGLQNFPTLTLVETNGHVVGNFAAAPGKYTIDIYENAACDDDEHGEGQTHIDSFMASESDGTVSFDVVLDNAPTDARQITATATDSNNNTSEFGPCFQLGTPTAVDMSGSATSTGAGQTEINPYVLTSLILLLLTAITLSQLMHRAVEPRHL